ncbi:YlbF family regulator [bacterium]|nr:YlbF family regulator [bacterium]
MDIETEARQLGRLIAQTPEYRYYESSSRSVGDDQEMRDLVTRLQQLEESINHLVHSGQPVPDQDKTEYESVLADLQGRTNFQALISSQENYLKLMNKVNEYIAEGIREGGQSRIITNF